MVKGIGQYGPSNHDERIDSIAKLNVGRLPNLIDRYFKTRGSISFISENISGFNSVKDFVKGSGTKFRLEFFYE